MAFKTMDQYNEERYGGFFLLRNDKDFADVVFLYRGKSDVLIADTHYVKSADYTGYVHCCGKGCPACGKGIRVQTKLFIPLYNYATGKVEFWDRSVRFENQLVADVFDKYPNPSEFVFRITRNGAAGDLNTTYSIVCIGANTPESGCKSYETILAENNIIFPNYYDNVVKEFSPGELYTMLNTSPDASSASDPGQYTMPNYQVTPRRSANPAPTGSEIPNAFEEPTTPFIPTAGASDEVDSADEEIEGPVNF